MLQRFQKSFSVFLRWRLARDLLLCILCVVIGWRPSTLASLLQMARRSPVGTLLWSAPSYITGLLPFSVAELLFFLLFPGIFLYLLKQLKRRIRKQKRDFISFFSLSKGLRIAGVLYVSFFVLFGFAYVAPSDLHTLNLPASAPNSERLRMLCLNLVERANGQRRGLKEREGIYCVQRQTLLFEINEAYRQAASLYPFLAGSYGPPKMVFSSPYMSYTHITGIYIPWTGEANVNTCVPDLLFASTALHEMAHQRGIAKEEEANFVAYLVSSHQSNLDIAYSGTALALLHSLAALQKQDPLGWKNICEELSEAVKRDIDHYQGFWKRYAGSLSENSQHLNDRYLKVNRQSQGVQSYGLMVDLLLRYQQKTN